MLCADAASTIETWYETRAEMQSFGLTPALQRAKVDEVTERSSRLGQLVASLLQPVVSARLSAKGVVEELSSWAEMHCNESEPQFD